MHRIRLAVTGLAMVVLTLAGCADRQEPPLAPEAPQSQGPSFTRLDSLFAQAASEFDVPVQILKAIGFVETRWQMVEGGEEFPDQPTAHGIMALRGERLERGARLAGVTVAEAKEDAESNIRAAAALLAAYAAELGISDADLGAWAPAVARYSGIESPEGQAAYVHQDVYAVLQEGVVAAGPNGVAASIMPVRVRPDFRRPSAALVAMAPDYPSAVWRPSPNYNSRPTGDIGDIHMVIIHTCEGSYTSCWSWLTNSASGVSAHYVVREDGSEISQLVHEANRAWHIGATYECSRNASHECWRNGYSSNHFTVGIEHGGFASQTSWPTAQIDESAKLVCDITRDRGIPRDKYHILGHAQLQPYNRTDPGANWPWSTYYAKINSYCESAIIVDSNNNNNDTSRGYVEVSANWTSSNATAGYYGTGYWWAGTQAVSDPADFWFYLPSSQSRTIDAWWTAGSNRAPSAPYVVFDANGTRLATVYVNQQANGGKWNTLGSWTFPAGWNRVSLSRWTTSGYVVIADAVRIR